MVGGSGKQQLMLCSAGLIHLCFMGDLTPRGHVTKLAHVVSRTGCGLPTGKQVPAHGALAATAHITCFPVTD